MCDILNYRGVRREPLALAMGSMSAVTSFKINQGEKNDLWKYNFIVKTRFR
jgi:hypothetical protein